MSEWKQDLDALFTTRGEAPHPSTSDLLMRRNKEARTFIDETVMPAFEDLQVALSRYGRVVVLSTAHKGQTAASMRVRDEGQDEFEYLIGVRVTPDCAYPFVELVPHTGWTRHVEEDTLREGAQDYCVSGITKDEVISHFLSSYKAYLPS